MKKSLIILSILFSLNLFADEQVEFADALAKLNKATTLLIKKYTELDNEMKQIKTQVEILVKSKTDINTIQQYSEIKEETISSKDAETNNKLFKNTQTTKKEINKKVVVISWNAKIREKADLNAPAVNFAMIGNQLNVISQVEDFYKLKNNKYINVSSVVDYTPRIKTVKRDTYSKELIKGELVNSKLIKASESVKILGTSKNKKWYITDDGSLVNYKDISDSGESNE